MSAFNPDQPFVAVCGNETYTKVEVIGHDYQLTGDPTTRPCIEVRITEPHRLYDRRDSFVHPASSVWWFHADDGSYCGSNQAIHLVNKEQEA